MVRRTVGSYNCGVSVIALGLNHTTAPLDLRGRLAFAPEQTAPALQALRQQLQRAVPEAALVSTCNRTELYVASATPAGAEELVRPAVEWLATQGGIAPNQLQSHSYVMEDRAAARHAFRVASGLDSMVLGEPQILGQMKQAVRLADEAGTLGTTLHQLFQRSFSVAKEVRSSTEIGAHSVSMAAASVRLASQLFEDLAQIKVLFIGAGEMIELCARHFHARGPRHVAFANRTTERAAALAEQFGAESLPLADVPAMLARHDIVVSCTASPLPIIGKGMVERALKARRHRPMVIVDLAVPRDVEPEVAALGDVFLYTVDDLGRIVREGLESRSAAVDEAESIISGGVAEFMRWLESREMVPAIRALRDQAERMRRHEMERALKALARGDDPKSVLESLSQGLTNKLMHAPTQALHGAEAGERDRLQGLIARLFAVARE